MHGLLCLEHDPRAAKNKSYGLAFHFNSLICLCESDVEIVRDRIEDFFMQSF